MKIRTALILFTVPCLAIGCSEPPRTAPTTRARELGGVGDAVTFLDSEQLRAETGEMDSDAPTQFQTTDTGIQYRILRDSEWQKPTVDDYVVVQYRGWLDNGRVFDSSYTGGKTSGFELKGVIGGWTEGLQLIGVGGMIELWIPAELGYGARSQGSSIPPNAPLHFIVELVEIR